MKRENQNIKEFNLLVTKIAKGEKYALEEFYKKYSKLMYSAAYTILKRKDILDEVIDDVLIKIWKVAQKCEKITNPQGWLYRITVNTAKDRIERDNIGFLDDFDIKVEDKELDDILDKDTFYWYIRDLKEKEQQILIYKFIEDLTFENIAKKVDLPEGTVAYMYYSALEKVHKKISQKNLE